MISIGPVILYMAGRYYLYIALYPAIANLHIISHSREAIAATLHSTHRRKGTDSTEVVENVSLKTEALTRHL